MYLAEAGTYRPEGVGGGIPCIPSSKSHPAQLNVNLQGKQAACTDNISHVQQTNVTSLGKKSHNQKWALK